jgi:hypothetical protein
VSPTAATEILISEAYRWAFSRGNRYGYASAYAVLIFGVLLVYTSRLANRLAGQEGALMNARQGRRRCLGAPRHASGPHPVHLIVLYPVLWVLKMALTPAQSFSHGPDADPESVTLSELHRRDRHQRRRRATWLFGRQLFNSS